MDAKNIAAHTAPGPTPPFISVNRNTDNSVTVYVRSANAPNGFSSSITLSNREWVELLGSCFVEADGHVYNVQVS